MKPILFNTEMVRAILDGRKTQTRRVVPGRLLDDTNNYCSDDAAWCRCANNGNIACKRPCAKDFFKSKAPYRTGDILYVRETWQSVLSEISDGFCVVYKASENGEDWANNSEEWTWRPSIHMPKEAARIFLQITEVRVERLQEISQEDLTKEGFNHHEYLSGDGALISFSGLWNSIIKRSDASRFGWNANPWVWVYEFERCYLGVDLSSKKDLTSVNPLFPQPKKGEL